MTDTVHIVAEDQLDGKTRILQAFDNPEAANAYVEDPDNEGHLFVTKKTIKSEYSATQN